MLQQALDAFYIAIQHGPAQCVAKTNAAIVLSEQGMLMKGYLYVCVINGFVMFVKEKY